MQKLCSSIYLPACFITKITQNILTEASIRVYARGFRKSLFSVIRPRYIMQRNAVVHAIDLDLDKIDYNFNLGHCCTELYLYTIQYIDC
jgi:hypothetical protein